MTTLHALIIEDNPVDTKLLENKLCNAGYDVKWVHVLSESDYIARLEPTFDLIIADYSPPRFNALKALHILKEKNLDIPFIVVTGTASEEMAVECMKQGASDYLFRDRLDRLGQAVEQALHKKKIRDEKRLADETLRKSEEKSRSVLDSIKEGYFEVDLAGSFTFFNDSMCRILGYSSDEMMNMNNREYTSSETAKKIFRIYNKMYRTEKASEVSDYEVIRKDGIKRVLEVSSQPLKDERGSIIGFMGVARDVTEHRLAETALQESEKRYRDLVEKTNDIHYTTDEKGIITYVSPVIESKSGYSPSEVIGRPFTDFVHTDDLPERMNRLQKVISGKEKTSQYRYVTKTGKTLWIKTDAQPIINEERVTGIRGILTDITDLKEAEEKVKKSEERYRVILESIQEGYFEVDLSGKLTFFNNSFCRMYGYTRDELMGMNSRKFLTEDAAAKLYEIFHETYLTGNHSYIQDFEALSKNGSIIVTEISASLMKDENGRTTGFRGVTRDVTERRKAEDSWRRSDFIVNTSKNWMSLINEKYIYEAVNDAFCRAHQKDRQQIIGRTVADIWGKKIFDKTIKGHLERCFAGEEVNYQTYFDLKPFKFQYFDVSYYPYRDRHGKITNAVVVSHNISDRKKVEEELQESFIRLQKTLEETIDSLAFALQMKDPFTADHQRRVAELACRIAKEMNFTDDCISSIRLSSLIHDIGKIHIPSEILSKPSKLSEVEFDIIKTHSQAGYDILKSIEFPWPIADIVLQHHERLNGSGYPSSLREEVILKEAKVMAVADVVEAISSHRPYRPALGMNKALEEISEKKGVLYDSDVVNVCLNLFSEGSFTFTA